MTNQGDIKMGGRRLVLVQYVFSAVPLFYFLVFKLPVGMGKPLERLMRHFLWKGIRKESLLGDGLMGFHLSTY